MKLIDLAKQLGTDVPTLADLSTLGKAWSDATLLSPDEEQYIREAYRASNVVA